MKTATIREFVHHLSAYLKLVKAGEHLVLLERNTPIANILPYQENIGIPAWKRPVKRVKLKGEPIGDTLRENRDGER